MAISPLSEAFKGPNGLTYFLCIKTFRITVASKEGAMDPAADGNRIADGQLADAGDQMPRTDQFQVSWPLFRLESTLAKR